MRREIRGFRIEVVREALRKLGYRGGSVHCGFPSEYDEWRKGGMHVIVKERKYDVLLLHIHRDPAFHIGRVRKKGRDLELEVKLILKQMKQPLQARLSCVSATSDRLDLERQPETRSQTQHKKRFHSLCMRVCAHALKRWKKWEKKAEIGFFRLGTVPCASIYYILLQGMEESIQYWKKSSSPCGGLFFG